MYLIEDFLKELEQELNKTFYKKEEIKDLLLYYEEIINDRLERGERVADILRDYDPSVIAKSYVFETYEKRTKRSKKEGVSILGKALGVIFTTPLWIALGVLFFCLIVTSFALMVGFFSGSIGALGYGGYLIYGLITLKVEPPIIVLFVALILFCFGFCLLLAFIAIHIFKGVIKVIVKIAKKISKNNREKREKRRTRE